MRNTISGFGLAVLFLSACAQPDPASEQTGQVDDDLTCGPVCVQSVNRSTNLTGWSGGSCAEAKTSLQNALRSLADADCANHVDEFACGINFNIAASCNIINGAFTATGTATYHCGHSSC